MTAGLLTRREREVVRHMVRGRTIKAIARELDISPATVKNHFAAIKAKLGVARSNEVAARAFASLEDAAVELRAAEIILAKHPPNDTTSAWERKLDRVYLAREVLYRLLPDLDEATIEDEDR